MKLCEICGNEAVEGKSICPYCGNPLHTSSLKPKRKFAHRTVNLEQGRPLVDAALKHLKAALEDAKTTRLTILTLIHGYGSSGKGGAIRNECRNTLDYMCSKGEIEMYISGEKYTTRNGSVKSLLRRFPELKNDRNINKNNQGITIVVL